MAAAWDSAAELGSKWVTDESPSMPATPTTDGIVSMSFLPPKAWPCCNYPCSSDCDLCPHVHDHRSRVLVVNSSVLNGRVSVSRAKTEDAAAEGVSVLYKVTVGGRHVMSIAAVSSVYTAIDVCLSRSHSSMSASNKHMAAFKISAINNYASAGRYSRCPFLLLCREEGHDWWFHTAVVCSKASNKRVGDRYYRRAPVTENTRNENRSVAHEFAEAHQACVEMKSAPSFDAQVKILHDFYRQRISGRSVSPTWAIGGPPIAPDSETLLQILTLEKDADAFDCCKS